MRKLFVLLTLFGVSTSVLSHAPVYQQGIDHRHGPSYSQQRIKIYQRNTIVIDQVLNGYRAYGPLMLSVGDITHSQVMTTVSFRSNGKVLRIASLRQGQYLSFTHEDVHYRLKLVYLLNKPIGHDYAVFNLMRTYL